MKNQKKFTSGFTLIELLMVIAIIAILSSVALSSVSQSREKSKRASAITTAVSVIPELISCNYTGGFATNTTPVAGNPICATNASPATTLMAGHTATWPSVAGPGWSYDTAAPSGLLSTSNYTFKLIKSGQTDITCSMATGACN